MQSVCHIESDNLFFFEKAILRGSFKAHPRSSLLEFLLRVCVCVRVSVCLCEKAIF